MSRTNPISARSRVFLFSVLLLSPVSSFATDENVAEFKQVLTDKGIGIFQATADIKVGDELVATSPDGTQQCTLKISKMQDRLGIADIGKCPFNRELRVGQKLSKLLLVPDSPDTVHSPSPTQEHPQLKEEEFRRSLLDLVIFPNGGAFTTAFAVGFDRSNLNSTVSSLNLVAQTRDATTLSATVQYGITSGTFFGIEVTDYPYDFYNRYYDQGSSRPGSSYTSISNGFANPTFQLGQMIVTQTADHPLGFYLETTVSPNMFEAKSNDHTTTGTEGSGGNQYDVILGISHDGPTFSFGVRADYTVNDSSAVVAPNGSTTVTTGGNNLELKAIGQINVTSGMGILASVAFESIAGETSTSNGISAQQDPITATLLTLGARFVAVPNKTLLTIDYQYILPTTTNVTVSNSPVTATVSIAGITGGVLFAF